MNLPRLETAQPAEDRADTALDNDKGRPVASSRNSSASEKTRKEQSSLVLILAACLLSPPFQGRTHICNTEQQQQQPRHSVCWYLSSYKNPRTSLTEQNIIAFLTTTLYSSTLSTAHNITLLSEHHHSITHLPSVHLHLLPPAMSRWGISSIFWPSMATQASRERSRPAAVYRSYSIQTSAAPAPASHRVKHRAPEYGAEHGRDYREPRAPREKHRGRESYSNYDGHNYGRPSYNHRYDYDCDYDYDYAYTYPQRTHAAPAPYYSSKPSSSTATTASSASTAAATAAPHRRSQSRHASTGASTGASASANPSYKKEEERVSKICYGGGDARGHRYYASYQDYKNEKAKNPEKRVHWADEQPAKGASRKSKSKSKSKAGTYVYDDGYYRGAGREPQSPRAPKSPRHRYSDGYYGYDDEVDRRSRKTRGSQQQRWY